MSYLRCNKRPQMPLSVRSQKGLLNLAINEDDLHLDEEDKLTTYKAGDGLETYHCKQCGVQTHQKDAEGALQLNLRAMNGLNVDKLKVTKQNKSSEG